ncbi:hypothetical protein L9F63_004918 [Diploptera punctata]|uniref:BTB domain-containing protein n=1 Tax=Diploptera punctata TaxID=6984 RepID=A0AAD7ZE20_DIPPU|nr:hypothetical protein L9F63_004918 [Diploptera punctata]
MSEAESEQFSLRWNNFHSNLTSGFHALLQGEDLVDVTLAAGGQFVQAHKIVLSVCSPYFKELFKVNPCKHPIVILKDVDHKELVAILQFMYQGEVNVRQEELATFLKTAEMLQIKGLTGENYPSEDECTSIPAPQAVVRQRAPRRVVDKVQQRVVADKPPPPPVETIIAEPEEKPTPPYKRMRQEVPSPVISSPIVTEESHSAELPDITNPKQEPVDYDAEIEEVDRIQNREDALAQLLGAGESSQSLQDSAQGSSIFAGIPSASQDPGVQDSGQEYAVNLKDEKNSDVVKTEEGETMQEEMLAESRSQDGLSLGWNDPWRDVLLQLPGRKQKDCCVCSERPFGGKRRRAKTMCAKCKRGVHRMCALMHN